MIDPTTAALDPIFWLHHANIDRLWEVWLRQGNRVNPRDTVWLTDTPFDFFDATGTARQMTSSEVLDTTQLDTQEEFVRNSEFHTSIIECSRNTLLFIAVQPVFSALQTNLSRSVLGRRFHREVHRAHERITDAIEAHDEDAAGEEMRVHIEFLVPYYERAWRDLGRGARAAG